MEDRDKGRNEELRRNVVEKMWLNYYHNELLARGLITESMYRKMKVQTRTHLPHLTAYDISSARRWPR